MKKDRALSLKVSAKLKRAIHGRPWEQKKGVGQKKTLGKDKISAWIFLQSFKFKVIHTESAIIFDGTILVAIKKREVVL